ncbi:hypothetical protein EET67_13420 [Pseudaminobacter arsenicus]|uniref:DUF6456 domain-containing protein n=1 Tax=Borborobacter arsenicus TaxID=1851146 RepID=A0A432V5C7_9HYPH|nr:DUF6456 domain-containing protein [Pseudaminobacter arsenicus]RUM97356.1 hypothetical protein EET67_13420 [Pseudaminobacter arsenicus]
MTDSHDKTKSMQRITRLLAGGPAAARKAALADKVVLEGRDGQAIAVDHSVLTGMVKAGTVLRDGDMIVLAPGRCASIPERPDVSLPGAPRRELGTAAVEVNGEFGEATINLAESPLAQLMRFKTKHGAPFLSRAEFEAGERLRADYTRGQIMPRLGANWTASVASGRRGADNCIAELTDSALSARMRVDRAIAAVGPELSGVLIDICCFLKGLELVERERGWPVRSAKIVLKTALGALSRHYRPQATRRDAGARPLLHWGSEDYRPKIS